MWKDSVGKLKGENSLFVPGMKHEHTHVLAKKYGQEAYIHRHESNSHSRLHNTGLTPAGREYHEDGHFHEGIGTTFHPHHDKEMSTRVPGAGRGAEFSQKFGFEEGHKREWVKERKAQVRRL